MHRPYSRRRVAILIDARRWGSACATSWGRCMHRPFPRSVELGLDCGARNGRRWGVLAHKQAPKTRRRRQPLSQPSAPCARNHLGATFPCGNLPLSCPASRHRSAGSPDRPAFQRLRAGRGTYAPPPLDPEACASNRAEALIRSLRPRRPKPSCQAVLNSVTRSVAGSFPPGQLRRIAPSSSAPPSCEGVRCFSTYTLSGR